MTPKTTESYKLRSFRAKDSFYNMLKFVAKVTGVSLSDIIRDGSRKEAQMLYEKEKNDGI